MPDQRGVPADRRDQGGELMESGERVNTSAISQQQENARCSFRKLTADRWDLISGSGGSERRLQEGASRNGDDPFEFWIADQELGWILPFHGHAELVLQDRRIGHRLCREMVI